MNEHIQWQKSSFSGANGPECIEIAHSDDNILVRESDESGLVLTTTPARLRALILTVQAGEFDRVIG